MKSSDLNVKLKLKLNELYKKDCCYNNVKTKIEILQNEALRTEEKSNELHIRVQHFVDYK